MKNFLLFALLPLFCDTAVDVFTEYFYIQNGRNWDGARWYCREKYQDLATINNEEEHQILTANGRSGWVGLHRSNKHPNTWLWSDERLTNFFKWATNQPDNSLLYSPCCVKIDSFGWYSKGSWSEFSFYCQERVFLVKENKTWDEALEYCRSKYTGLMLNVSSVTWLNLAANVTQPVSVWTGLRFLDGKWIWLNGAQAGSLVSLPSCPVQTYRCGARNFNNSVWENRDCNEKLYFLCY